MGMTVFSGMLVATILGVPADSDAVRRCQKVIGGAARAGACRAPPPQKLATEHGQGGTEMPTRAVSPVLFAVAASGRAGRMRRRPELRRPKLPTPPEYRFVEAPAQAQSLADAPWFQVFDDPALQALIRDAIANNLDLRVALAHVEEARARAGIAKSYSTRRSTAARSTACAGRRRRKKTTTRRIRAARTGFSCRGRSTCSAACGAGRKAAHRAGARERAGPRAASW